jgi:hypothetical protein
MSFNRREPQRSSGRALIASGIGMMVLAGLAIVLLIDDGYEPMSWRSALTPVVALLGVPVGIAFVVAGVAKIRRGER